MILPVAVFSTANKPTVPSPPSRDLRRNTAHEVTREFKTGTLARVQQVEYWHLLPMGWTAETDELATTLKL
jgi:hypothetical protein